MTTDYKTVFQSIKEVKGELKNNCFYIYLVVSENKFRVYDIRKRKDKMQVKIFG